MQAALPIGPHDRADLIKCQLQAGMVFGVFGRPYSFTTTKALLIWGQIFANLCGQPLTFLETDLGLLLGLNRD